MKKVYIAILLLTTLLPIKAQEHCALIPMPNEIVKNEGRPCKINSNTRISISDETLRNEADYLINRMQKRCGITPTLKVGSKSDGQIRLSVTDDREHKYSLKITQKGIDISGSNAEDIFNAIQTLDQWMIINSQSNGSVISIEPTEIHDSPLYCYRALMLDPARHFLPITDVKRFIDEMVRYKFNVLQLHLTDDQGWRIEIKSHPELTANGEHYTQAELRDLINYAEKQHVQIVPELDIPGHTYGLLTSHPELLCSSVDTLDWGRKLRTDVMLCCAQENVYPLMSDVLKEVCELFPSEYIHLGGDESLIEKNWGTCSHCQALKAKLHYERNDQLMGYFFSHFWDQLREAGKRPILWIEMDNIYPPATRYLFDYPKDVTLVSWRQGLSPKAIQLTAEKGNELIMAPGEHCYFDYPQYRNDLPEYNNWGMPMLTLEDAYKWNPSYPDVESSGKSQIKGVMGTLWGEAIVDINRAFYMAYPRALALAEAGWSDKKINEETDSWTDFKERLRPILSDMIGRGIPFRVPFEIYR